MLNRLEKLRFLVPLIAIGALVFGCSTYGAEAQMVAAAPRPKAAAPKSTRPSKPKTAAPTPAKSAPAKTATVDMTRRELVDSEWGQVNASMVNVRTGPGMQNDIVVTLRGGEYVRPKAIQSGWLEIEWPSNVPLWASRESLLPGNDHTATAKSALALRSRGSRQAAVIAKLDAGTPVTILGEENGWFKIRPPQSVRAYISAKYVLTGVQAPAEKKPTPQAEAVMANVPGAGEKAPAALPVSAAPAPAPVEDSAPAKSPESEEVKRELVATVEETRRKIMDVAASKPATEETAKPAEPVAETAKPAALAVDDEIAKKIANERAEEELRAKLLDEARQLETARRETEAKAKAEVEEQARRDAEAKRLEEIETARHLTEAKAKAEAEEQAKRDAEAKRLEEIETARHLTEARAKAEAEEQAKRDAEAKRLEEIETARRLTEAKAKADAEEQARRDAEAKRLEEIETARREAEAKAKADAEKRARLEAEEQRLMQELERAQREAAAKKAVEEAPALPAPVVPEAAPVDERTGTFVAPDETSAVQPQPELVAVSHLPEPAGKMAAREEAPAVQQKRRAVIFDEEPVAQPMTSEDEIALDFTPSAVKKVRSKFVLPRREPGRPGDRAEVVTVAAPAMPVIEEAEAPPAKIEALPEPAQAEPVELPPARKVRSAPENFGLPQPSGEAPPSFRVPTHAGTLVHAADEAGGRIVTSEGTLEIAEAGAVDGARFALVSNGIVLHYLTPRERVDLDSLVGRRVAITGTPMQNASLDEAVLEVSTVTARD